MIDAYLMINRDDNLPRLISRRSAKPAYRRERHLGWRFGSDYSDGNLPRCRGMG